MPVISKVQNAAAPLEIRVLVPAFLRHYHHVVAVVLNISVQVCEYHIFEHNTEIIIFAIFS